MKRPTLTLILVLLMVLTLGGCWLHQTGPCVGYGCSAFSHAEGSAPQPSSQNRQASAPRAQAHDTLKTTAGQ